MLSAYYFFVNRTKRERKLPQRERKVREIQMQGAREIKKTVLLRGHAHSCSPVGRNRTQEKSLISTPLFSSPFPIIPLWLFPFFFPSSLSCRVRVQLGDKGIETGSSLPLCQTIWLYTAVISPLYLSPSTGLCDELEQESSLWAPECVCVCACVCEAMFCIWTSVAQL